MGSLSIDNIANQITIETISPISSLSEGSYNGLKFIKSQRKNKYSSLNCPPYLIHVGSMDGNIDNLHLMNLGKILADQFPSIVNIRRLGKNLIVINFKFNFDASLFNQIHCLISQRTFLIGIVV